MKKSAPFSSNRREFIRTSLATTTALTIGFTLFGCESEESAQMPALSEDEVSAWLVIAKDGTTTIRIAKAEMGQGITTALAMIIAEELRCDWQQVRVESALNRQQFPHAKKTYGSFLTDGSASVRGSRKRLQRVGAEARERLLKAGAMRLGVEVAQCEAKQGRVWHESNSIPYEELVVDAASIKIDTKSISLRTLDQYELIGTDTPHLDVGDKVNGRAVYPIDVEVDGALIASVRHAPQPGARIVRFEARDDSVQFIQNDHNGSIFALSDSFWKSEAALRDADIEWSSPERTRMSDEDARRFALAALDGAGRLRAYERGAPTAGDSFTKTYSTPYQAHSAMEPISTTIERTQDGMVIHTGTQDPEAAAHAAQQLTGLDPSKIAIRNYAMGGSFGRRISVDFVREAIWLALESKGSVKLIWPRGEDVIQGHFRPVTAIRVTAKTQSHETRPAELNVHIASQSILRRYRPAALKDGIDPTMTMGADDCPYDIPRLSVDATELDLPFLPWLCRSVGDYQTAFAIESFIDEYANSVGVTGLSIRRTLLESQPAHLAVLDELERQVRNANLEGSAGLGYALHENSNTLVGVAVKVRLSGSSKLNVDQVIVVADCGPVVNPIAARAQAEGSVVWGIGTALWGAVAIDGGRVQTTNFDTIRLLRLHETPDIRTHFISSREDVWGGMGEPVVPPIAPALCNAIVHAGGPRVRDLPLSRSGFDLL